MAEEGFNLGSAYGEVRIDVSQVGSAMQQAKSVFDGGIAGMGSTLQSLGGQITQITGSLSMVFTPMAAGIAVATNAALDFNEEITNTGSVLGLTIPQIAALGDEIQDIGADTRAGPQQVALAMYDIAGGVADASTHMAILNATIHTAQAGNANLTGTTKALVSVMNSYKYSADRASFASDVLTRTVGMGVGSMDQFASAFPSITGLANSLGIEFEDLGGMMAYLTTQGNTASEAATQLTNMMTAMLNPNAQMIQGLREMGYESGQAAIEALGLDGAYEALAGTTVANQNGMAKLTGNVNALRGATALAGDDVEDFMNKFRGGVEGATAAAEAIQLASPQARLDLFNSSIQNLGITIGETLIPRLAEISDAVKPIVDGIAAWVEANPRLSGVVFGFISLLGIALPILATAGILISAIGTAWTAMSTGILATAAAAVAPFLLIGAAVAGAAYFIINNIETIRDGLADLATALITGDWSTISENINNGIQGALDSVKNFDIANLKKSISGALATIIIDPRNDQWAHDLSLGLYNAINHPADISGLSLEGFRHSLQGAMATIMIDPRNSDSVDGLARAIYERVNGLEVSDETFGAFAARMQGSLSNAISNAFGGGNVGQLMPASVADSMGGAGGGIAAAITNQLTSAIASIQGVAVDTSGITTWATTNMNSIIDAVAAVAVAIIGGPIGLTIGAAKLVSSAIETDFLGIGTFLSESGITASVSTAFESLKAQIGDILSSVFGGGSGNVGLLMPDSVAAQISGQGESNPIADMISRMVNGLKSGIEIFGPELRESLQQIGDGISGFFTNIAGADVSGIDNIIAAIMGIVGAIGGVASTILLTGIDIISDIFENVLPAIGTAIGGLITILSGIGEGDPSLILQGIGEGLQGLLDMAGGLVSGAIDPLLELIEKIAKIDLPDTATLFNNWRTAVEGAFLSLQVMWDNLRRGIERAFNELKISLLTGIQTVIDGIAPALEELNKTGLVNIPVPSVQTDLTNAQLANESLDMGDQVADLINAQIASTGGVDLSVPITFSSLTGDFTTTLGEAITGLTTEGALPMSATASLQGIGLSIVDGVVQGVDTNAVNLTNSTTALAELAASGFVTALGIASPSTVFMGYGSSIIQGLVLGLTLTLPLILIPTALIIANLTNISTEAMKIPISFGAAFAQAAIAVNIAKIPILTALDQIADALVKVTAEATRAAAAIAAAVNANIPTAPAGSVPAFARGVDNVPQDTFAYLHRGEAVLTADENAARRNGGGGAGIVINGGLHISPQINPNAGPVGEQAQTFADLFMEEVYSR